jgi:hypothetical protein
MRLNNHTVIVLFHSLYSLYALIQRPPNLFSRLRIPFTLPVDRIRALLLSEAGFGVGAGDGGLAPSIQMPPDLELLLSRLKTDESRGWFVRCVHTPLPLHSKFMSTASVKRLCKHVPHAPQRVITPSLYLQAPFSPMYVLRQCYYCLLLARMGGIDGGGIF